ncbi:hypothetical protein HJ526_16540 [Donghicola sp. C2-DW-16]|uniref:Uncharacterized protein n=1 Tax=Donghicola mangrovi TaxID=2729614 RepID=A0A850QCZ3_9RHOB|nr:hypothetical protein [Donghicola mangrovi]NVO24808.1 hypothetical protein [Donghicola mangrovi]NVO29039.1 hypothetical protein [Donghicola mangrovi]
MTENVTLRIIPSTLRIWMGVGALFGLGGLLLYLALAYPPASLGLQIFLILFGLFSIYGGARMMQSGRLSLELNGDTLTDSQGRLVATIDNIVKVERGAFAFKPSHGFVLHLSEPMPRAWFPGIYWRMGRRVAVGGVLPGGETKAVADIISARKSGIEI